jgi:hypothetical protein
MLSIDSQFTFPILILQIGRNTRDVLSCKELSGLKRVVSSAAKTSELFDVVVESNLGGVFIE